MILVILYSHSLNESPLLQLIGDSISVTLQIYDMVCFVRPPGLFQRLLYMSTLSNVSLDAAATGMGWMRSCLLEECSEKTYNIDIY